MTSLEIYLFVAPLILLLVGILAAWLGPKWIAYAAKKAEQHPHSP